MLHLQHDVRISIWLLCGFLFAFFIKLTTSVQQQQQQQNLLLQNGKTLQAAKGKKTFGLFFLFFILFSALLLLFCCCSICNFMNTSCKFVSVRHPHMIIVLQFHENTELVADVEVQYMLQCYLVCSCDPPSSLIL